MIDYIIEKRRKSLEKWKQRENTLGHLVEALTLRPIMFILAVFSTIHFGLMITISLIILFLITGVFSKLEDLIFYLMGKRGMKPFTKFPVSTTQTWISVVVALLVSYFLSNK